MNLWILTKPDYDYGQTYQALVAAQTEAAARLIMGKAEVNRAAAFEWVDPETTTAVSVGAAFDGTEPGVLMTKESAS